MPQEQGFLNFIQLLPQTSSPIRTLTNYSFRSLLPIFLVTTSRAENTSVNLFVTSRKEAFKAPHRMEIMPLLEAKAV